MQPGKELHFQIRSCESAQPFLAALILAQRARWAAAIRARPAALMPPFFPLPAPLAAAGADRPSNELSCRVKESILSLITAARLSWAEVSDSRLLITLSS